MDLKKNKKHSAAARNIFVFSITCMFNQNYEMQEGNFEKISKTDLMHARVGRKSIKFRMVLVYFLAAFLLGRVLAEPDGILVSFRFFGLLGAFFDGRTIGWGWPYDFFLLCVTYNARTKNGHKTGYAVYVCQFAARNIYLTSLYSLCFALLALLYSALLCFAFLSPALCCTLYSISFY